MAPRLLALLNGINAQNRGTGALSNHNDGHDDGYQFHWHLRAYNSATGTSLTVTAEDTTGTQGIKALKTEAPAH